MSSLVFIFVGAGLSMLNGKRIQNELEIHQLSLFLVGLAYLHFLCYLFWKTALDWNLPDYSLGCGELL